MKTIIGGYFGMTVVALQIRLFALIYEASFWFIAIVFLVFVNDAFAYLVGKSIGKRQLTKLSPNKSLEGFFGGFVGSIFLGIIFYTTLSI